MKTFFWFLLVASGIACSTARANEGKDEGGTRVFALDAGTLAANRKKIAAKDPALMDAYNLLLKDADEALNFGPVSVMEKKSVPPSGDKHDYMSLAPYFWPDPAKADGLPYIRKDGQTNPEVKEYKDKEYLPKLCAEAQTLALAWYFSGSKIYAEHAANIIRVWFLDPATRMNPNLNYGQAVKGVNNGRGAGMIDIRHFVKLVDAIGLLQTSKYWTKADETAMQKWCADFLNWMQTSEIGRDELDAPNNHGAWYEAVRLSLALYTGNREVAKQSVNTAKERIDAQIEKDGSLPKEMVRTMSLHYTVFALEAFFNIAAMAAETGEDLWNYTGKTGRSLKLAFDAVKPYIAQEKEWTGQQIKKFDFEEGHLLLMEASRHFNCSDCKEKFKVVAGDKAKRLRINLLY